MVSQVKINGLDETVKALRALPTSISGKNGGPLLSAMRVGAKVLRDEISLRAPKDSGNLAESIVVIRDPDPRQKNNANERLFVAVRKPKKSLIPGAGIRTAGKSRGASYAHIQEFGSKAHKSRTGKVLTFINKRGERIFTTKVKGVKAQPFMRPGFESKKVDSVNAITGALRKRVASAVRRARKLAA